ncbi:MAG: ABC transporter substrate-binding protein [Limnochordia bacterium]|jgi:ABC-type glycerol-3-phosphate transport system substrate-binding protein
MAWSVRRLVCSVFAVMVILSLTAQGKTMLSVGTWLAPESWSGTYGPQMDLFERTNPDIGLDVMTIASHKEYAAKVAVLAATGSIPDVLQIPPEQVAPLAVGGVLENLDPWIERDKSLDTRAWIPGALNAVRYAGIMFGMPGFVVNYTYAYNKEILAQRGVVPPAADSWVTWNEIRDIARRTTVDADGDGQPEIWGYYHGTPYTQIIPLIYQAGGRMFDKDNLLNIDVPEAYKAMNWLLGLIRDGLHGGSTSMFLNGKVASIHLGSGNIGSGIGDTPVGVTSGTQDVTKGEVVYVTSFALTTNAKEKEAAWRYLKYLTSRESQEFVVARGRVPIRRDVTLPLETRELLTGLMNSLGFAEPYPYHVHSDYIQTAFDAGMRPVWQGQAAPETVVPQVQRAINAYISQQ